MLIDQRLLGYHITVDHENTQIAAVEYHFSCHIVLLPVSSKCSLFIPCYFLTSASEPQAELGIEFPMYTTSEDEPNVNVCVVVNNALSSTTVVEISTSAGTAVGKTHTFLYSLHYVQTVARL